MRVLAVIVLTLVLLLSLSVVLAAPRFQLASEDTAPCMPDVETRERVREILLKATEEAFHEHVKRMYEVWARDDRDQPRRAQQGVRQGLRAYLGGRQGALKWNPPLCPKP